uniref:Nuclease n=2 Tax=Aromatoleum toluolicum TaxID=90060 RepID=A0ABX1NA62_9RHOO|nr:nuclease [Aromatoleum toluolicum]
MQTVRITIALLWSLLVSFTTAAAGTFTGTVVGIADGDTVTVLDAANRQHKVRLSGIDAPEKSQPYGNVSRQHLARLVFDKDVTVVAYKTDRYGRTVGKVVVNDTDANLEQIRAGLAWHYKQYEREQDASDRETYATGEVAARQSHLGLWRESEAVPPWEYRRQRRGE